MGQCDIIPLASKACSGKCRGTCSSTPRTWVVAACGGMISLFEKKADGHLHLLPQNEAAVAPSVEGFLRTITNAAHTQQFDRLLIVGSANDVAWMRHAVPNDVAKSIAAEIEYPLVPSWFNSTTDASKLIQALETLF